SGHRCVALLGGTGECTAEHRRVHCWAQVGTLLGTGCWNWWVALLGTDHQGTDHQCPDDCVRKVQPRAGNCISR
ncbi:unnamed protein product, partial [Staurois parvus]